MTPTPEQTQAPRRGLTAAIVPALAAAGLAGLVALYLVSHQGDAAQEQQQAAAPAGCITGDMGAIGGPIALIDTNNNPVTQADFAGAPAVVYFGFTHCPDVCPTTMYALAEALQGEGGYDIQPIMISLDPERDTPAALKQYVASGGFPEGLAGLTGTPEQIRAAAGAFKVAYSRQRTRGAEEDYSVDHSSFIYVMDEQWRTVAVAPTIGASPQQLAACIGAGLRSVHG